VNTSELATKIAETHSVSKMQAQAIVDSMLKSITSAAANGDQDLESSGSRRRRNARGEARQAAKKLRSPLRESSLFRPPRR